MSKSMSKSSSKANDLIFDQSRPFSVSKFWQGQREYYQNKGIEAWADEVPFYITSNPFIGQHYAELIIRFAQDWTRAHPDSAQSPFYLIELGAGSGQFSYYLLKSLQHLINSLKLSHIKFRYVMTDFSKKNIEAWREHAQLKPFVDCGLLDFAVFDLEKDTQIKTLEHSVILGPNTLSNPLTIIANYLFDSVVADIFHAKNQQLYASLITLKTKENLNEHNTIRDWKAVKIEHTEKLVQEPYYTNPIYNDILNAYKNDLEDSFFLFPIGCLNGLENLKLISNNKLFLISSDKGQCTLAELDQQEFPEVDFHGSFSLMVNYHAINAYFKRLGGQGFLQTPRDGLTTAVFNLGFDRELLSETNLVLEESVEGFSATDFFNYYELVESSANQMQLNALISTLCVSRWDPTIFNLIVNPLCRRLSDSADELVAYLISNLYKIRDNFFYVPGCEDTLFALGFLLYNIDHYEEAIKFYEESRLFFGESHELLYNLALCYFYNNKYERALENLEKAKLIKPNNAEMKKLIKQCKNKLKINKK